MNTNYKTIDEYIANYSDDVQKKLNKIRQLIKKIMPDAEEAIRYQMPTFRLNGRNIVHFAAYKSHIGFYPTPSGLDKFEQELKPYRSGKGTAQFPLDEPIPYDLLEKIVKFRLAEEI